MAITVLEAQEMLLQMQVSDYPHLKKEPRQRLHRQLHRQAYPGIHDPNAKPVTTAELNQKIGELIGSP
jgi:hypothetical protein